VLFHKDEHVREEVSTSWKRNKKMTTAARFALEVLPDFGEPGESYEVTCEALELLIEGQDFLADEDFLRGAPRAIPLQIQGQSLSEDSQLKIGCIQEKGDPDALEGWYILLSVGVSNHSNVFQFGPFSMLQLGMVCSLLLKNLRTVREQDDPPFEKDDEKEREQTHES
jgi:hypothetical protein